MHGEEAADQNAEGEPPERRSEAGGLMPIDACPAVIDSR
jgi:hypothetical protein